MPFNSFRVQRAGLARAGRNHRARRGVSPSNGLHADLREKGNAMLGWALTFLIVALIAALLGFGGIAGVAVEAAKIVFFVAVILFAISAIAGLMRGRSPTAL